MHLCKLLHVCQNHEGEASACQGSPCVMEALVRQTATLPCTSGYNGRVTNQRYMTSLDEKVLHEWVVCECAYWRA